MLDSILNLGSTILDKIIPDAGERDRAKLRLLELQQAGELKALEADLQIALGQVEVNKAEAQSGNPLAATWRPAVGWVCVLALGYHYLVAPLVSGLASVTLPTVNVGELYPLLFGMLGLGGFRTFEKVRGAAR